VPAEKSQVPCSIDCRDVAQLGFDDLAASVRGEKDLWDHLPDGRWEIDPRSLDRIVYNSSRANRPHDNRREPTAPTAAPNCIVCSGQTTRAIDVCDLSDGCTFINKNLYPMFFPDESPSGDASADPRAFGLHFLQWTSSRHERDWHNLPLPDLVIVLQRLGALEWRLLRNEVQTAPLNSAWGDAPAHRGYVSIIKNYGQLVGGSVEHGHQQIAFGNVMPRRQLEHRRFEQEHGEKFSEFMLRTNPSQLLVRDYGAAALLVPFCMKRPYEMVLLIKNGLRRYVHELDAEEMLATARGWQEAIRAIRSIMPAIGRETAYNVVTHNGPGAGLYFEFLPYTQEIGGYEHLGLFVCQGNPADCATKLREAVAAGAGA
jgi:galactose-1-phosphate uridylyltransferase